MSYVVEGCARCQCSRDPEGAVVYGITYPKLDYRQQSHHSYCDAKQKRQKGRAWSLDDLIHKQLINCCQAGYRQQATLPISTKFNGKERTASKPPRTVERPAKVDSRRAVCSS